VLSSLWGAIAAGDPLRAELETSTCMAIPHVAGQRDPAETESFVSTVLVNEAIRRQTPDGAAMLRTLMSLGTPAIRKVASRADRQRDLPAGVGDRDREGDPGPGLAPVRHLR
jgi:hypothetical protein